MKRPLYAIRLQAALFRLCSLPAVSRPSQARQVIDRGAALRLMEEMGMAYDDAPPDEHGGEFIEWTGALAYTYTHDVGEIYHEIAHYQVATPRERQLPNYGLGNTSDWASPDTARGRRRDRTEQRASVLGILWLMECAPDYARDEMSEHGWECDATLWETTLKLYRLGLITADGVPLKVIR